MKKIILILLFSLLWVSVEGADILEDFAGYTEMLRMMFHRTPTSTSFIDDTTAHQFIRLSVITLSPILKADKATFWDTTVTNKNAYALDTTIWGILGLNWIKADTIRPLVCVEMQDWYNRAIAEKRPLQLAAGSTPFDKRPYYYDHIDDTLFLFPSPTIEGDSIRIIAWQKVKSIAASDKLSDIPQKYRAPIVHYAAWLLARSRQHPQTEQFRLGFTEALQIALGANIKAPTDAQK